MKRFFLPQIPDRRGVLGVFYPLKTRVFKTFFPVVQNMRKMTHFHLVTTLKFSFCTY